MGNRLNIIFFLIFTSAAYAGAQTSLHPIYSGALENILTVNPAAAGSHDAVSLSAWYRRQWTGISDAPSTLHLGAHFPLANRKIGIGTELWSDQIGEYYHNALRLSYAYRVIESWGTFSLGINTAVEQIFANNSYLDAADGTDPVFSGGDEVFWGFEAGTGAFYYNRDFSAGIAVHDLPDRRIWQASGTWAKVLSESITLRPSFLVRGAAVTETQADLGLHLYLLETFRLGGKYRTNGAWMMDLEYRFNSTTTFGFAELGIGYGYEIASGEIRNVTGGSHEVYILYRFNRNRSRELNPRFF